jgi:hypothetical protein
MGLEIHDEQCKLLLKVTDISIYSITATLFESPSTLTLAENKLQLLPQAAPQAWMLLPALGHASVHARSWIPSLQADESQPLSAVHISAVHMKTNGLCGATATNQFGPVPCGGQNGHVAAQTSKKVKGLL